MKNTSETCRRSQRITPLMAVSMAIVWLAACFAPYARAAGPLQLTAFDALLDSDRSLAIDLTGHPALLRSTSFLDAHPALSAYFKAHPEVQSALAADPALLVFRERRFFAAGINEADTSGNRLKRTSIDSLDSYLEGHTDLARALRQDPTAVDSPEIMKAHPALAQLLSQDPAFARSFKLHPGAFLNSGGFAVRSAASAANQ